MKAEIGHLAACLCRAGGLEASWPNGPVDWTRWLALADEHRLEGYLYARLRHDPPWPDFVNQELAARYSAATVIEGVRMAEQVKVYSRLASSATFVALKGFALSLTLYREAAEREMADLDLLHPDSTRAQRAAEFLLREGFWPSREIVGHHHAAPLRHPSSRWSVELHTNLTTPPLAKPFVEHFYEERREVKLPSGILAAIPSPSGLLFHHCLHAVKDPLESPLLRNLFEIAALSARMTSDDWNRFSALLAESGREEWVCRALALCERFFPLSVPPFRRPSFSTIEFWALRRLQWTGEVRGLERLVRHIGVKHFDRMPAGRWRIDLPRVASVTMKSLRLAIGSRWRAFTSPHRPVPLSPSADDLISAPLPDAVALLKRRSGQVYVLNGAAAAAWETGSGALTGRQRVKTIISRGYSAREARAAIQGLVSQGLLAPACKKTLPPPADACKNSGL